MTKTKKILIPIIAILVLASVVGIGFAAWLIVNPVDKTVDGGSFVADEVKDYTYTATAAASGDITFGKGAAPTGTNYGWLSATEVPADVLTATITVTLTPTVSGTTAEQMLNGNKLKVAVSYKGVYNGVNYEKADAFNSAVTANYLANPTLTVGGTTKSIAEAWGADNLFVELTAENFTAAASNTYTAEITIKFAWGEKGNPYTYFNGLSYSKDNATAASAMLSAVRELNDAKYQIHLETVAPSTGA